MQELSDRGKPCLGLGVRGHRRPRVRSESRVQVHIHSGVREGSVQSGKQMMKTCQTPPPSGSTLSSGYSPCSH